MELIRDLNNWKRVGQGKALQFFATDAEVHQWLLDCIPGEYLPYRLVGADLTPRDLRYVEKPFACELDELQPLPSTPGSPRSMFFIWSENLTPDLFDECPESFSAYCSLNGLVALEHGGIRHHKREPSSLMIVDRVRNQQTGMTREHREYRRIYNSLARCVKRALCYSTILRFRDGTEEEDTKVLLMTELAAQAYGDGFSFQRAPSRRLDASLQDKR
jgi:hypothetical protein